MSIEQKQDKNQNERKPSMRAIPQSDIDFQLMTVDTMWGSGYVNHELKRKLEKGRLFVDADGKEYYDKEFLWDTLNFYTRDMRLGNLGMWSGELEECSYYLNLAGDFLDCTPTFVEPFMICLRRVATILELSQSKGGFLRKRMNTFTQESYQTDMSPPKKNMFGMLKGGEPK